MCVLPLTGSDSSLWLLIGLVALVVGAALLVRTHRGRVGIIAAAALLSALIVTTPQPAYAADCATPPAPTTTVLTVSPTTWNAGATASTQSFIVTNSGTVLSATNVSTGLTGSAAFSLIASTCAATLAPGASCTVTVSFAPPGSSLATLTATLTVSADNAAPVAVALEGTDGAVASLASLTTGVSLSLGSTVFVTVTNTSTTAALNIVANETTGIVTLTNNCGPVLAPGSSCDVAVYAPFTSTLGTTQVQIAGDNTNVLTLPTTVS